MRGISRKVDARDERLHPAAAADGPPHEPPHETGSCTPCAVWRSAARRKLTTTAYLKTMEAA